MSDIAIKVEGLSKKYRIGSREEIHDTFLSAVGAMVRRPFENLERIRKLSQFEDDGEVLEDVIWALKDVSFELKHGDVLGVIGRNGAGKSTLLKVLSRIIHPTEGRVEIYGRVASLLEVGTGFHQELTGRENVYLNGTILGMTKGEIDRKFDEIVDFSGVEKFIDTPVKRYSSGMRVRLAFSVAAHLEPEILLVDEVLAVGDIAFQRKCIGKMGEVAGQGRTVLFVSHNMATISSLCEKGMLLENGEVQQFGDVEQVVNLYYQKMDSDAEIVFLPLDAKSPNLSKLCVLDGSGKPAKEISMGEGLGIQVEFQSPFELVNPILGIRINTSTGVTVFGITNLMQMDVPLCDASSSGVIRAFFPDLRLNQGVYYVTLMLSDNNGVQVQKIDVMSFTILPKNVYGTTQIPSANQSLVLSDGEWAFLPVEDSVW